MWNKSKWNFEDIFKTSNLVPLARKLSPNCFGRKMKNFLSKIQFTIRLSLAISFHPQYITQVLSLTHPSFPFFFALSQIRISNFRSLLQHDEGRQKGVWLALCRGGHKLWHSNEMCLWATYQSEDWRAGKALLCMQTRV